MRSQQINKKRGRYRQYLAEQAQMSAAHTRREDLPAEIRRSPLAGLPFWCHDNALHERLPDTYHEQGCCFNHAVGLPFSPINKRVMPLAPFQVDYCSRLYEARHPPGATRQQAYDAAHTAHKFHLLKGRQMGFTEMTVRYMAWQSYGDFRGTNLAIMAGNNGSLARKNLKRMTKLFTRHHRDEVSSRQGNVLDLVNGTVTEAFAASEEAMTGDTKYGAVLLDENAKWKLVDDSPVFNSVVPIVETNGSDFYCVSTPKGPQKMHYNIWKDPKDFIKLEYDIWHTEGNLYTRKHIETMIANSTADPNQEFLCKWVVQKDSIFGEITDDMRFDGSSPSASGDWGIPEGLI